MLVDASGLPRNLFDRVIKKLVEKKKIINHWLSGYRHYSNGGFKLIVPKDMVWAFKDNHYEEFNVEYWLKTLANRLHKPVFYDIGSNFGYYSIILSTLCEKVYAFEPVNKSFSLLKENIDYNGINNIVPIKRGIYDTVISKEIYLYNASGCNSLFHRNIPADHPLKRIGKEKIDLTSLDNFIEKQRPTLPDLVKIDIEGAELPAIVGAQETFKKKLPVLLFEYSSNTSGDAGYSLTSLVDELQQYDYELFGLSNNFQDTQLYIFSDPPDIGFANLIAIPRDKRVIVENDYS